MFDKKRLAEQVGRFFGDYHEDSGQLQIDTGDTVYSYHSPDELLGDWVDTLAEHQQDAHGEGSANWEREIEFIYDVVLQKYPKGIRPNEGLTKRTWRCSVDVTVPGQTPPHGKNLFLGSYASIVEAMQKRREFMAFYKGQEKPSLEALAERAQEIRKASRTDKKQEPMTRNRVYTPSEYFAELSIRLRQIGLIPQVWPDGLLSVSKGDMPLCRITGSGGVRYSQEDMVNQELKWALDKTTDLAVEVKEYMEAMSWAQPLQVAGLDSEFLSLAEFNNTVLAAQETKYGVHFVTWDWDFDRKGLSHGHYYESNYLGAKQDFATRSDLIDQHHLFSDEQLAEVYRCVHETLESHYPMTVEREKLLKAVAEQIEYGVPSLDELVEQSNLKEMEAESSEHYHDMTQHF